ncbi:MAG: hypothetical protein AAFY26_24640 [Cyanobacteria bacterium J06638_22]
MAETNAPGIRMEQYTLKHPKEVLIVTAVIDGEPDQVAIFRGFSSSLMRPTAFDPEVPVLPTNCEIVAVDRLQGPYDPAQPQYIEKGITWETMDTRLQDLGL